MLDETVRNRSEGKAEEGGMRRRKCKNWSLELKIRSTSMYVWFICHQISGRVVMTKLTCSQWVRLKLARLTLCCLSACPGRVRHFVPQRETTMYFIAITKLNDKRDSCLIWFDVKIQLIIYWVDVFEIMQRMLIFSPDFGLLHLTHAFVTKLFHLICCLYLLFLAVEYQR